MALSIGASSGDGTLNGSQCATLNRSQLWLQHTTGASCIARGASCFNGTEECHTKVNSDLATQEYGRPC